MAEVNDDSEVVKPLEIIIVGGSIGGLIAGILLKRNGHNIRILEKAASSEREGMAAGIGLSLKIRDFFENEDSLKDVPLGIPNDDVLILNKDLNVRYKIKMGFNMTSWDTMYYRLRANFDALESGYCPIPPVVKGSGQGNYETGREVTQVANEADRMIVLAKDAASGQAERLEADLVIAADGGSSAIRRQLLPELNRAEPGYVIWRGTVPTTKLSQKLLDKIEGNVIGHTGKQTYCVIYTIPGENGSLEPGHQHINFAWYFWPTKPTLDEIMTDTDGHRHRTTVPKGKLRPKIWDATIEHARLMLPGGLTELLEKIPEPFVSVISSISAPQAAYFDNKLFLIGDALTQTQPNIGQGSNLAATAAIGLANAIGPIGQPIDPKKIQQWEQDITSHLDMMRLRSRAMASWYLESWFGLAWDAVPALLATLRHRIFGRFLWRSEIVGPPAGPKI